MQNSLFCADKPAEIRAERSFEGAQFGGGHGVFTYYVAKGMEGAADTTPRDTVVSADELADYVHTQVREATGGQQNPTSEKGSFDPNMFLALVPANAPPGVPPAPKFGTLIFESNMDDVTITIDGKTVGVVSKSAPCLSRACLRGRIRFKGTTMGMSPMGPAKRPFTRARQIR